MTGIEDLTAGQQLAYGEEWFKDLTTSEPSRPPQDFVGDLSPIVGTQSHGKGSKATRNNNPSNITGMGGKLLYGAIGFAKSNTGDAGDRNQLVYATPQAGFQAFHRLASSGRYNSAPINKAFSKWQTDQVSFRNKLSDLARHGVDTNKRYRDLSPQAQKVFRMVWSKHEGYKGEFY